MCPLNYSSCCLHPWHLHHDYISQLWKAKWMLQYFPTNVHLTMVTTRVSVECSPQMLSTSAFVTEYRAMPFAEQISGVYSNRANKERSKVGLQCDKWWGAGCFRAGESASPPGRDWWMMRRSPDCCGAVSFFSSTCKSVTAGRSSAPSVPLFPNLQRRLELSGATAQRKCRFFCCVH